MKIHKERYTHERIESDFLFLRLFSETARPNTKAFAWKICYTLQKISIAFAEFRVRSFFYAGYFFRNSVFDFYIDKNTYLKVLATFYWRLMWAKLRGNWITSIKAISIIFRLVMLYNFM